VKSSSYSDVKTSKRCTWQWIIKTVKNWICTWY